MIRAVYVYVFAVVVAICVLASLASFVLIAVDPRRRWRRWRAGPRLPTIGDVPEHRIVNLAPGGRRKAG